MITVVFVRSNNVFKSVSRPARAIGIESSQRFIQKKNVRFQHQRAHEAHPPLLAAGKLNWIAVKQVAREVWSGRTIVPFAR